ncbi:peptidoglycan DD-metalloendopeptidase family protein [Salinimicrobium terrae]|uniref:peptidoglycan DD-metalloendopeptidase family protein n=1 Tax=Salinimicrobium terrae TaxID=470866 RepID=UPI0003FD9A44|nr:peptidoglycan DD-metalloendopeptidase family protein [Salinimicrobium terrae]
MKRIFAPLLFLFSFTVIAQAPNVPTEYFDDPLQVPLALSGTFGELRSNHFHSGLDIKTQQREGLPVYASAEGFVSRINVAHYGYGKAIYIQHPNGYTTVYGHLKNFSPKIEEYIKKLQYQKESYEVQVYPEASELPVERRELIANSGNTGGSGGPHLHYEIRDGEQRPMNPLMFGIELEDTRAPIVSGVFVYPKGENAHVNGSAQRQKLRLIPQQDGSFRAEKIDACGEIGFGINAVDQLNAAPNHNGVYRIETSANGEKLFQANFEIFSFSETRHLNQLIDYDYYARNNSRIQKLFVEPSNPLSIYSDVSNQGLLNVKDSLSYNYTIRVSDFSGNERIVTIPIEGKHQNDIKEDPSEITDFYVPANAGAQFEGNGIDVYIPKNSLYQDASLDISFEDEKVILHEDVIPIHTNITIGFDLSKYQPEDREQMFIARLNKWGNPNYSTTTKDGERFTTKTRNFGTYTLGRDTQAPRVVPVNFKDGQWISGNKNLKVKISDDLSGIKSYRATVNGKFILMEYEYKQNLLTHDFADGVVTDTENQLKIEVIDNVGNTTIFESTFFRK